MIIPICKEHSIHACEVCMLDDFHKAKPMPPTKVFIKFEEVFLHPRKITRILEVYSVAWNNHLGTVKWYAPWRKYCFYPGDSTIFDSKCLQDIQGKIDELMSEQKGEANENRTIL